MRLRDQVIGALNLFRATPGPFEPADLRVAQALADVATIGLLQERNLRRSETMAEQLQAALNSRVVIEQAKGKLAERRPPTWTTPSGCSATTPATPTSGSPTWPGIRRQPLRGFPPPPGRSPRTGP